MRAGPGRPPRYAERIARPARVATLAAAAALALALGGGCGDDEQEGGSEVIETVTGERTGSQADGATPAADREVSTPTQFTSPDANIGCVIEPSGARCDIAQRDWKPPLPPRGCKVDFGQGLELRAGGTAALVCAGDTTLSDADPLALGESISSGLIICESAEDGISCRDVETGRGFRISRGSYEVF